MKNILISLGLCVLVVVAIVFSTSTGRQSPTAVTIGVIAPLSGQYAFLGESERNAMLLAQKDFAAKGVPIKLIFEDDKYEAKTGLSAYQKLKTVDSVDAVVAVSAPVLEALKPVVASDKTVLTSLGESLFHEDDTVFQLMPASNKIAPKLGEEAGKRFKKIAVVYSGSGSLWKGWHDDFVKGVDGKSTTLDYSFAPNSDLRTETVKVVSAKPDATTVFLPLEDGIKYLKELELLDPSHSVKIICDGNLEFSIQKYVSEVGAEIFDHCISTTLPDTMTTEFVSAYKLAYSSDPILTADYAYDAVALFAELSKSSKGRWLTILKNNYSQKGASGTIHLNNVGTRDPEVVVHQFINGKFQAIIN